MNPTVWLLFIDFLNRHEIGDKINRKDILKYIKHNSHWTLDGYRNILTHLGYLNTIKPGVYELIRKISYISLRNAKDRAFGYLNGKKVGR